MSKEITIYTRTNCPYCVLLKKYFDLKNITYSAINIEEDSAAMDKVMSLTGRTIAPTTVVSDKENNDRVVVGYNLANIVEAINR